MIEAADNFIAADVMELADMQDLGSCAARRAGSSPVIRIKPRNEGSGVFCGLFYFLNLLNNKQSNLEVRLPGKFFLHKRKRLRYNSPRLFLTI